jgi:hypothetical protein
MRKHSETGIGTPSVVKIIMEYILHIYSILNNDYNDGVCCQLCAGYTSYNIYGSLLYPNYLLLIYYIQYN